MEGDVRPQALLLGAGGGRRGLQGFPLVYFNTCYCKVKELSLKMKVKSVIPSSEVHESAFLKRNCSSG